MSRATSPGRRALRDSLARHPWDNPVGSFAEQRQLWREKRAARWGRGAKQRTVDMLAEEEKVS